MPTTTSGSELAAAVAPVPSTLGGAGWSARVAGHAEEVRAGLLWTRCGYRSESAPLLAVMLGWPPDSIAAIAEPAAALMTGAVDLGAMRAETEAVAAAFESAGVRVLIARPDAGTRPNFVFMRDLFVTTPDGIVLGRVASRQRAGEERYAAAALAAAGYPILATAAGHATLEGADALWLDRNTVMVGIGFRTNAAGAECLRRVLGDQGVAVVTTTLGRGVQHLLGAVTFLDERLAALHGGAATGELRALLRSRGIEVVELAPDDEVRARRAMNLVALGPRRVLMPAGAPGVRRRLERSGVEVAEIRVDQHIRAAGALGCMTGILRRDEGKPGSIEKGR
ncbi:dimethylarginine dimethylaminohydrolase family protein [Paractinoplanes hotanensis]|uniref:Arginine deiminase family protein n=1 Tax=Paractinoplanes hotanensis TaxID=2906497 RepID=A0ABT0YBX5_9ACTN|nr:arginine deiminase family protein [Actinoplanes hotanensis]MCM4083546.1 arginine deiminase family protein [Actinoplanes hotanensis]